MERRVVAAAAVVVVVISLAGCSVLLGDGGAGPSTATPIPEPTATATPTPGPAAFDYPDGYGPDGVTDATAAAETHAGTLAGYDSYRIRFDVAVGAGNGTESRFSYRLSVDQTDETALEIREDGVVTRRQYYENDRLYANVETPDGEQYNATDAPFAPEAFGGGEFIDPLFGAVDYGTPERVETDNGTVYRYRSERVTDPRAIVPGNVVDEGIRRFDVQLLVHEDGYVRGARYTVVTEKGTELQGVAVVDSVGDERVERPAWYDRAAETG